MSRHQPRELTDEERKRLSSTLFSPTSAFYHQQGEISRGEIPEPGPQEITTSPAESFSKLAGLIEDAHAEVDANPPRSGYDHNRLMDILDEALDLARRHA